MKILFVTPRFPYPPYKGDRLRAYHQIKQLSKRHSITLASLIESEKELDYLFEIGKYCDKLEVVLRRPFASYLNVSLDFFSKIPWQVSLYKSSAMKKKLEELIETNDFDLIHTQLIRTAPYFINYNGIPKILDMVDALSINMKQRFKYERFYVKPIPFIEWKKIKRYEAKLCRVFDKIIVSSEFDKNSINPNENIVVCPNGVDTDFFYFTDVKNKEPSTMVFTGNMGYFPNIDAVLFFTKKIFPLIKKQIFNAKFYIAGINPPKIIRNLAKNDSSIVVTGFVKDIRIYLNRATVAVCPIRSGSGIQNKILEAMASGVPVVATEYAISGICAIPGKEVMVTNQPEEFANRVVELLEEPQLREKIATSAVKLVRNKYSWNSSVKKMEKVYKTAIEIHTSKLRKSDKI